MSTFPTILATQGPEPLYNAKEAARLIGVPVWKLARLIRQGIIPSYRLLNSRRLVRLSEIESVIQSSRAGGQL